MHRASLWRLLLPVVALVATFGYVTWSRSQGMLGFPLDDAWIHQTYARNLAETGQLAYVPGQPSAGSTSPAWSFLLSVGYLLGVDYRLWAYLLGGLALAATAWLTYRLFLALSPNQPGAALLTALLCAGEWHLVWAAASGMETILFAALSLALLAYGLHHLDARRSSDRPASLRREQMIVDAVGIGLLGGALTLTRPEGLGLVGLMVIALLLLPSPPGGEQVPGRLMEAGVLLLAFGIVLAPYLAFNLRTSGSLFPNTFYAKQAEYQIQFRAVDLPARLWQVLRPTLVGAQVLLLPGFCFAVYRLIRDRRWHAALPLVWWLVLLAAYAVRLPVSYHHGRYAMPTIALLILYGGWGTARLLRPRSSHLGARVLSRGTPLAVVLLAVVFLARGALAYRDDVGFVDGEMVAMAGWLNEHTAAHDLIAVHDIGAVGYLTQRPLLDLAGLITPEVIPFLTDADRLGDWMVQEGASYAVFFPDFSQTYVQLAADPRLQAVHCTDYAWTRTMGHHNMCAYRMTTERGLRPGLDGSHLADSEGVP
jgi:arabinofuranosyltransferase